MQNIFEALKVSQQVGNVVSSMQAPDIDKAVLEQALAGTAAAADVVLELYQSGGDEEIRRYTVAELQAAVPENEDTWRLANGETLWL